MSNKLIFSLMSKKWHADGGDIYFNKHLSAINNEIPLLYLNNESKIISVLVNLVHNKYFVYFFRFPLGSFFYYKISRFVAFYIVNISSFKFSSGIYKTIIIPSGDLLAFEVAIKLKLTGKIKHIHFSILDLPWTYQNSKINNSFIKNYFLKKIDIVDSADFISDSMRNVFIESNSKLAGEVVYPFVDLLENEVINKNYFNKSDNNKKNIKIVFAGNLRFKKELIQFVDTYSNMCFPFQFHLFSSSSVEHQNIINHEFVSSPENLKFNFEDMDFGFIPFSFDIRDKELVETSFPSKFASYLSAGLPVIVFAPLYSTISKFVIEHELGVVLNEITENYLNKIDTNLYTKPYIQNKVNILREITQKNYEKIRKLLNIVN